MAIASDSSLSLIDKYGKLLEKFDRIFSTNHQASVAKLAFDDSVPDRSDASSSSQLVLITFQLALVHVLLSEKEDEYLALFEVD
jgi:hypothetical protein